MRPLHIASVPDKDFVLETALPESFLFVQAIARQHAETQEEFNEMCVTGLKAARDFGATADSKRYHSFAAWVVRNHILKLKGGK